MPDCSRRSECSRPLDFVNEYSSETTKIALNLSREQAEVFLYTGEQIGI